MKDEINYKTINLRLTESEWKKVHLIAQEQDRSITAILRRLVRTLLESYEFTEEKS